jgi:hypothetical protein
MKEVTSRPPKSRGERAKKAVAIAIVVAVVAALLFAIFLSALAGAIGVMV